MVFLSRNFDTQKQTYEYNAAGWIYWSWSNLGAADWSYQTGLKYGWIPSDASQSRWGGVSARIIQFRVGRDADQSHLSLGHLQQSLIL
jgi:hypothetical protein